MATALRQSLEAMRAARMEGSAAASATATPDFPGPDGAGPPAVAGAAPPAVAGGLAVVTNASVQQSTTADEPVCKGPVKWKPVEVITQLAMTGGFQTKQLSVESRRFDVDDMSTDFVYVNKKTEWLAKMAGGSLKRAADILDTLKAACVPTASEPVSAVADTAAEAGSGEIEVDPMGALDAVTPETPETPPAKRQKKGPTPKKTLREHVVLVDVHARSPTAWPWSKERRIVKVLLTNIHGKGKLWISRGDLPWLIAYVADEVGTGGVRVKLAVAGLTANCNTPYLSIRLTPELGDMGLYTAVFVGGPLKENPPVQTRIKNFNQAKWEECKATGQHWSCPGGPLADAGEADVARATAHYLELVCARMLLEKLGHGSVVPDPIAEAVRVVSTGERPPL